MMRKLSAVLALAAAVGAFALPAFASDGPPPVVNFAALATDRIARNVGDALTVIVYESSSGSGSAENATNRNSSFQGQIAAGNPNTGSGINEAANLGLGYSADNNGATTRAGTMVGQISVTVDQVLPNGDLHVSGVQVLNVNGERTRISVKGRVRQADITAANVILSTSLADATIDYDGAGIVSASAHAGIITRALNWLGIP
jgi:flagellar L-ring protein precursor FlgH